MIDPFSEKPPVIKPPLPGTKLNKKATKKAGFPVYFKGLKAHQAYVDSLNPNKTGRGYGKPRAEILKLLEKATKKSHKQKGNERPLRHDDELFLRAYLTNGNHATLAEQALGTPKDKAGWAGSRRLQVKAVRERMGQLMAELREKTNYATEQAMEDFTRMLDLSVSLGQMSAAAKFLEMKVKVAGVLKDSLDINVKHVDLKGILEDAQQRARNVIEGQATRILDKPPEEDPAPVAE